MKHTALLAAMAAVAIASCTPENETKVKNPIQISSPTPTQQITKVTLNETQQGYVTAGNAMSFRLLKEMYTGESLILSPLSLQYALAMTANGASDETLQEIVDFLGYGAEGIDALNEYCRILLEQLPAVSLNVKLKVTNALLVNDKFPLLPSFQKAVEENYYAAVENSDFSNPALIAARINEWANRNTEGVIKNILDSKDISPYAVAFLMNALYFKAKWAGSQYDPMFRESGTKNHDFTLSDGSVKQVKMMSTTGGFRYSEMDGFSAVVLPYAGGNYYMGILLPDTNDLSSFVDRIPAISWEEIWDSAITNAEVHVKIPKFDIENKFYLKENLKSLGVNRAFDDSAQFDQMFAPKEDDYHYWIENVIQKAKITVAEWGTEAAAVTVVQMVGDMAAGPKPEPRIVYFTCDHPFVFIIGERTSGTILFEGTFTGK
jgi:serpin B